MPVSIDCFLDIAKSSIENNGEQWTRNAISRAYYTMYHSALQLTEGFIPIKDENGEYLPGGVHTRLAKYLCEGGAAAKYNLDVTLTKKVGLKLKTAHHRRVLADYELDRKINRLDALSTIHDAEAMQIMVTDMISTTQSAS